MKHVVESADELYDLAHRTEGSLGCPIIDALVQVLKTTRVMYPEDAALLLEVSTRDLRSAIHLLTGQPLWALMQGWRRRQARELLAEGALTESQIAYRCGWKSVRTLRKHLAAHPDDV